MSEHTAWQEHNREQLARALDDLLARIEDETRPLDEPPAPPALERLAAAYALSAFERDVVLLALGAELDERFRGLGPLTVGLALGRLAGAHWDAFDRAAPLMAAGLVEPDGGAPFIEATLRLDGDVRAFLLGFTLDPGPPFALPRAPVKTLDRRRETAAGIVRAAGRALETTGQVAVVALHDGAAEDREALALLVAAELDAALAGVELDDLPPAGAELDALLRRWARFARLSGTLLLVATGAEPDEARLRRVLAQVPTLTFVSGSRPPALHHSRPLLRRRAERTTVEERTELWQACLAATGLEVPAGTPAELAAQYRLDGRAIESIVLQAGDEAELRAGCREAVRARLEPLVERVPADDLPPVELPPRERAELAELAQQIRLCHRVESEWGLGHGRPRAPIALFAGPSGTGKTHAALTLARDVGFDLYRIDLASVVSKYVGETEKNLDRIFQAGALGGAILLFDEADALFGKRSEVKDSHDRYANLSTAYLLQKVEAAQLPTILTTNIRDALDAAFTRRLHFVLEFPFPDADSRVRIWESVLPVATPVAGLAAPRLGQLAVTGGTISNIARRAAFLAAAEDGPLGMEHLARSARLEARRTGREIAPGELEGW